MSLRPLTVAPFATRPWSNRYIGLPFNEGAAAGKAYNCWELCRLVLLAEFAIWTPGLDDAYADYRDNAAAQALMAAGLPDWSQVADGPAARRWQKAGRPVDREADLATFEGAAVGHVGLVTRPGFMLSAEEGCLSHVAGVYSIRWRASLTGIYRHASRR